MQGLGCRRHLQDQANDLHQGVQPSLRLRRQTYGNACSAAAAGVSIDHPGECGKPKPQACGGIKGAKCPDYLVCVDDPSDDCDPTRGGKDCPGICKAK